MLLIYQRFSDFSGYIDKQHRTLMDWKSSLDSIDEHALTSFAFWCRKLTVFTFCLFKKKEQKQFIKCFLLSHFNFLIHFYKTKESWKPNLKIKSKLQYQRQFLENINVSSDYRLIIQNLDSNKPLQISKLTKNFVVVSNL